MDSQFQRWKDWIENLNTDGIEPQKLLPMPEETDDTEIQVETIFLQNGITPKPHYVETIAEAIRRAGSNYYHLPQDFNVVINALLLAFKQNIVGNRKMAVLRSVFLFGVAIGHLIRWEGREK